MYQKFKRGTVKLLILIYFSLFFSVNVDDECNVENVSMSLKRTWL